MKKKGYIFSLMIFLVFLAVFITVIASIKSASVAHDATYEKTAIMKASNMCRNIGLLTEYGVTCSGLNNHINSSDLPFDVTFTCGPKTYLVSTLSDRYSCGGTLSESVCGDGVINSPYEACDSVEVGSCTHGCDMSIIDGTPDCICYPVLIVTINSPSTGASYTAGSTISFTGTASGGSGGYLYSWDFGGAGSSTGQATRTPTHSYSSSGTPRVTFTVSDSVGNTGSASIDLNINPNCDGACNGVCSDSACTIAQDPDCGCVDGDGVCCASSCPTDTDCAATCDGACNGVCSDPTCTIAQDPDCGCSMTANGCCPPTCNSANDADCGSACTPRSYSRVCGNSVRQWDGSRCTISYPATEVWRYESGCCGASFVEDCATKPDYVYTRTSCSGNNLVTETCTRSYTGACSGGFCSVGSTSCIVTGSRSCNPGTCAGGSGSAYCRA
jgi:hypothetical protein